MIYTVGRADIYEDYIKTDKNAAKRKGGSVWKTFKDVKWYINKVELDGFYIYGVEADWETDVENKINDRYGFLKRDAKLIEIRELTDIFPWVK